MADNHDRPVCIGRGAVAVGGGERMEDVLFALCAAAFLGCVVMVVNMAIEEARDDERF